MREQIQKKRGICPGKKKRDFRDIGPLERAGLEKKVWVTRQEDYLNATWREMFAASQSKMNEKKVSPAMFNCFF